MLGVHGFTRRVHRVACWAFGETLPPQARFFSEILTRYRLLDPSAHPKERGCGEMESLAAGSLPEQTRTCGRTKEFLIWR